MSGIDSNSAVCKTPLLPYPLLFPEGTSFCLVFGAVCGSVVDVHLLEDRLVLGIESSLPARRACSPAQTVLSSSEGAFLKAFLLVECMYSLV